MKSDVLHFLSIELAIKRGSRKMTLSRSTIWSSEHWSWITLHPMKSLNSRWSRLLRSSESLRETQAPLQSKVTRGMKWLISTNREYLCSGCENRATFKADKTLSRQSIRQVCDESTCDSTTWKTSVDQLSAIYRLPSLQMGLWRVLHPRWSSNQWTPQREF